VDICPELMYDEGVPVPELDDSPYRVSP